MSAAVTRHYLVACDFDQTLSFNDSGRVLSELLGVSAFEHKVAGLAEIHLVQQGAELAYLLRHDPEFRRVRQEHLVQAGQRVRLKKDIKHFVEFLERGAEGVRFSFFVVSAAPKAVVQAALEGIVPPDHIYGTEFDYDPSSGEICAIAKAPAGYGKVAIVEELEATLQTSPHRTIYVGDGNSDVHVMLRVNNRGGFPIAIVDAQHDVDVRVAVADVDRAMRTGLECGLELLDDCHLAIAGRSLRDRADLARGRVVVELRPVNVVRGNNTLERGLNDGFRRRGDHEERKADPLGAALQELDKVLDVLLQAHPLARLDQMLLTHTAELRVVAEQVGELGALLHEVDLGEPRDLVLKG